MLLRPSFRTMTILTACVALLVGTTIFAQQAGTTAPAEQMTAKLVTEMITRSHISQKPLDDRISAMLLKRMLKDLDPQKLYFLESDIEAVSKFRDQLDDLIRIGNLDFAQDLFFNVYLKRMDERVVVAHMLIDAPHDFTLDETMSVDGEAATWAASASELNERWRKRIKYDLLLLKLDDTPIEEARKRLHKRYDTLKKSAHSTEPNEVVEIYLSAMAHCFDPHSSYMSPQTLEDFQIQMRLSLDGIGAALRSEDGYTVVAEIVAGGGAEKDGRLKVKDKIVAVGQEDGDFVDIIEMKLSRVVRLIRGPGGTKVRLRVLTESGETVVYELTRQKIELKSSEVKGEIIPASDRIPGATGKLGVINIPSFYRDFAGAQQGEDDFKSTARDVLAVLKDFEKQGGVDAVVIDLRGNGGGALQEAIEVTGLFVDQGPVVLVKEQNGKIRSNDDTQSGVAYGGPLIVLCNRLSASASEIFAGAIKDYQRGIVIGDHTTHGKGTVQNVMPVSSQMFRLLNNQNRGALKLTINQFYRINGDSTQNRGVESDIALPSILDHMDLGESFLDNALAFDRITPAPHVMYDVVSQGIVAGLRDASQKRVAADAEFGKIQKDIQRYLDRKTRKFVWLNEDKLRAERDADKAANETEKEEEERETKRGQGPIYPKTAYNDEILRISLDYVGLLRQGQTAAK